MNDYYVAIVNNETDEPCRVMGPLSERRAEKVARGAGINNNWDQWSIDIIHADEIDEAWKELAK